ncbi:hypothetical protein AXG93_3571s1050 [Marchantia polymorpha subsp. ruderalis]|uniref:Reverse transcriptase Ty1/copia-type domain-containing protein n=1 Tax=Marchantia polymorpha subsp. ruderalis TaxID=1480154 RepID=A0A176VRT4_MARPO|nr:hypothetical protein AXG93_3571s1050 [Marchantia polymorpha subsp. ruderalis]
MAQLEGFVNVGDEDKVGLLRKSLYGLKQSPKQWYLRFDEFMVRNGFSQSNFDSCVYVKWVDGSGIFLLLYVDDMLIALKNKNEIHIVKRILESVFEMKDMGTAKKILGMEITRDRRRGELFVSQGGYLRKGVVKFGMSESKVVQTSLAAHFKLFVSMSPKTEEGRASMKRIPYASAVGVSCAITTGSCTGSSTTEAEDIATTEVVKESRWLKGLIHELGIVQNEVELFCDNQSAIHLTKNEMFLERTKHIDVKLHFIRDVVAEGSVVVEKMHTDENPADMATKAVTGIKFRHCCDLINVAKLSN